MKVMECQSMILRFDGINWLVDWTIDGLTRTYRFDSRQSAINRFPSAKDVVAEGSSEEFEGEPS